MTHSRRAILLTALLLLAASFAASSRAADKSDWASLKAVAQSQTVKVTLSSGKSLQGEFQSVSDDALVIRVSGGGHVSSGNQTFSRQEVRRVALERNGHRGKHTLIGAAIGAAAGLGAGAAIDADCSPNSIVCTGNKGKGILTPAFGLIGAGVGALLPANSWQEIYRSR